MGASDDVKYLEAERKKIWEELTQLQKQLEEIPKIKEQIQKQTPEQVQSVLDKSVEIDSLYSKINSVHASVAETNEIINASLQTTNENLLQSNNIVKNLKQLNDKSDKFLQTTEVSVTQIGNLLENSTKISNDLDITIADIKAKNKKLLSIADGVLDSVLRGTGMLGGVVATLKNVIEKYLDEKDKNYKADYAKVVLEGANISPPIGSKLKKLYSGLQQTKFEKDLIKERGWGVMQNGRVHLGPMYSVTGKVVEATANLPMDRLVTKVENISQMMNAKNKAWQRVMIGLGWNPRSIGVEESEADVKIREAAKATRKEEGKIKTKETRERKKDSISNLPISRQIEIEREKQLKRARRKMGGD
jgi:hypothetical protein